MQITQLENMVPNEDGSSFNAFRQDAYHMGTVVGTNVTILYPNFENVPCPYMDVVNTITGERIRITF